VDFFQHRGEDAEDGGAGFGVLAGENAQESRALRLVGSFIDNLKGWNLSGLFEEPFDFEKIKIIHKNLIGTTSKFEINLDSIVDEIELEDYVIIFYRDKDKENNLIEEGLGHNVSVGIASAITAYARIHMSMFKNRPDINLYYTDTDSVYVDSPLSNALIDSKILGKLKLENTCDNAIFLSPKLYCLRTVEGKFIYKSKGLSHDVELTLKDFEQLLYKDVFIEKTQSK